MLRFNSKAPAAIATASTLRRLTMALPANSVDRFKKHGTIRSGVVTAFASSRKRVYLTENARPSM